MNSEVEQRIVAMYFDNKDFEKNAKKTIDTLGELKDNLNLEDSVKGFEELNKAGKKLNLNDARTAVRNLRDSLGGLGEKIKNALNIGSGPLHTMRGFFNEFNGYITKVAGIDLAGKIVSSFENAFRQLTTAPIEAGWSMYQQNMDSTKTIMSGTLQSYTKQMSEASSDWTYNEGEHMEYVKKQLKELSDYAKETVFSLSDMTSNVGKFTNQGIDLETSVTAMEGIANMTAKAGQGAQQASMAMYNFSQALGVGKMTSIDWKSIENANLATMELKDLFIETAAAGGKLTKEISKTADGKELEKFFLTVDKNGKQLARSKWVEISAENFRDTLANGWLDKDTMLNVMKIYSGMVSDVDTFAMMGFDREDHEMMEYLMNIGQSASDAAKEVRTFSKMWAAMTESVQSGWAESLEYIFGNMQESTTFWTDVNKSISEVLDASADNRNKMLKEWRGYTLNETTGEWKKLEGAIDGREDLIQGIYGTIDAAKSLGSAFTSAWSDVFGNLTGKKLQEITKGFRDFIDRFKEWLGDMNDSNSRIRKIRTGLSGVFSVIKVIANVIKTGLGLALRVVKPLIDPILSLFEKFGKGLNLDGAKNLGEILSTLRDRFTALWQKLTTLGFDGVFNKIGEWFSNLWEKIKIGVSDFLDENGLSGIKEWFIGIGDSIQSGYETVKAWWEGSGIPEFFQGIWNSITGLFKGTTGTDFIPKEYNGNVDLLTRPKVKIEAVTEAGWVDEEGNPLGGDYATVLTNTFSVGDRSKGFDFSYKENAVINITPILSNGKVLSPEELEDYLVEITEEATKTGKTIKEVDASKYGILLSYDVVPEGTSLDDAYEQAGQWANKLHELQEKWDESGRTDKEAPIVTFFRETFTGIKGFFEEVIGWPIWTQIGGFFEGVWNTIAGIFTPTLVKELKFDGNGAHMTTESPIVRFLRETWEGVKGFFEDVQKWPIWGQIGGFFEGVWNTIAGIFTPTLVKELKFDGNGAHMTTESPIVRFLRETWEGVKGFFEDVQKWPIWGQIGGFFEGVWNTIAGIFTPTVLKDVYYDGTGRHATMESPIAKFFRETWESIRGVFEDVKGWGIWDEIGNFFSGIWTSIMSLFGGGDESTEVVKEVVGTTTEVSKTVTKNTPTSPKATEQSVSILERIVKAISGFVRDVFEAINGVVIPPEVTSFFENLSKVLLSIMDFIGRLFGHLSKMLNSLGGKEDATSEWIVTGIVALIGIISKVFEYRNNKYLSEIGGVESFAHKFMSLGIGILAIASAIALLTTVDQSKLGSAVGVIAVIGVVLGGIMVALTKLNKTRIGLDKTTTTERILTKLIGAVEKIGLVAVALALLPEVIRAFSEAKKAVPELDGTEIMNTLLGLAAAVAGISLALGVVQKITANQGIDPVAAVKTALAIAGFFGALITGFGLIGGLIGAGAQLGDQVQGVEKGKTLESVQESMRQGGEVLKSIGGLFNSLWAGLTGQQSVGEKVDMSQTILLSMAEQLETFTSEKTSGLLRVLNLIGTLAQIVQEVPDATKISDFAKAMEPLGEGLAKFNSRMQGLTEDGSFDAKWDIEELDANIERVRKLIEVIRLFSRSTGVGSEVIMSESGANKILKGLDTLAEGMNPERMDALASFIVRLRDALNKAMGADGEATLTLAQDLMKNVSNAIKIGLGEGSDYEIDAFDATPIVDSVVKALGYGETAIAAAVHSMVQAGLDASEKNGENGESGYKFDLSDPNMSGLMNFLNTVNDPTGLLSGSGVEVDKLAQTMLYGEGGTKDAPNGGLYGQFGEIEKGLNDYEFDTSKLDGKLSGLLDFKDPETGEPVDIAAKLKTALDEVQTQIDEMPEFKITIVPTFDYRNLNTDAIRNALREYPIGFPGNFGQGGTVKVDMTELGSIIDTEGLKSAIANVSATVDASQVAIVAAINSVEDRIGSLSSAISNIKLYLDTGVLVGGITPLIDIELGKRARRASSTGVASSFGNPFAYMLNKTENQ